MGTTEGRRKKSVTFGDHGSLIETLIDDTSVTEVNHNYKETTDHKVYPKEKYVTEESCDIEDVSQPKPPKNRVTFSEEELHTDRSEVDSITDEDIEPGVIRRAPSTESRDNPFQPDGDISKTADLILRHSKISASEVVIVDPTSPDYIPKEQPTFDTNENKEEKLSPIAGSPVSCEPDSPDGNAKVKENGTVEETVSPEQVQTTESSPKQDGETSPAPSPVAGEEEQAKPEEKEPAKKEKKCCTIL